MDSFEKNIRAGKVEKAMTDLDKMEAMTDVESILMNTFFEISMDFHTVKYIPFGPLQTDSTITRFCNNYLIKCNNYTIPSKQYEKVELSLTPFQLAIISTRKEIVRLFLNKIMELKKEN